MKVLRPVCIGHNCEREGTLRYFLCTEYGPKTYRAHAHGILFFQNKQVSDAVQNEYIFDAWKLCSRGNLRCAPLIGGGSSYVSKYVNKHSDYPSILQMPFSDTFYLASRHPAIGCAYLNVRDTHNQSQGDVTRYRKCQKRASEE